MNTIPATVHSEAMAITSTPNGWTDVKYQNTVKDTGGNILTAYTSVETYYTPEGDVTTDGSTVVFEGSGFNKTASISFSVKVADADGVLIPVTVTDTLLENKPAATWGKQLADELTAAFAGTTVQPTVSFNGTAITIASQTSVEVYGLMFTKSTIELPRF